MRISSSSRGVETRGFVSIRGEAVQQLSVRLRILSVAGHPAQEIDQGP
jgi:hypothetical protein